MGPVFGKQCCMKVFKFLMIYFLTFICLAIPILLFLGGLLAHDEDAMSVFYWINSVITLFVSIIIFTLKFLGKKNEGIKTDR